MDRHVTRVCRILPLQHKMVFVSISFSLSSSVGYRDLLEVVQEHAVFERPSVFLLSVSARSIVSPPSCNRRTLVSCNFWQHRRFSVMVLQLFRSMAFSLSSSLDNVPRFYKDVDSSLKFYLRVLERVPNTYRTRTKQCLKQIGH